MTLNYLLIWIQLFTARHWKELAVVGVLASLVVAGWFIAEDACMNNCGMFGIF